MRFKSTPATGARYWLTMASASLCGVTIGDVMGDDLTGSYSLCLPLLALAFWVIVMLERLSERTRELWYWLATIIMWAAATSLAGAALARAGLGHIALFAASATVLLLLINIRCQTAPPSMRDGEVHADGVYWLAVLATGLLGAIAADGLAHSINPVAVGLANVSLLITGGLTLLFLFRSHLAVFAGSAGYWLTLVVLGAWCTKLSDILGQLLSRRLSAALSLMLLAVILYFLRKRRQMVLLAGAPA